MQERLCISQGKEHSGLLLIELFALFRLGMSYYGSIAFFRLDTLQKVIKSPFFKGCWQHINYFSDLVQCPHYQRQWNKVAQARVDITATRLQSTEKKIVPRTVQELLIDVYCMEFSPCSSLVEISLRSPAKVNMKQSSYKFLSGQGVFFVCLFLSFAVHCYLLSVRSIFIHALIC